MGITIHFSGKINNKVLINELKDELVDISRIMKWKYDILDQNFPKSQNKNAGNYDKPEKSSDSSFIDGICITIHPKAEPFFVCIDAEGNLTDPINKLLVDEGTLTNDQLGSFIKTQFAPPDIHICVINLLRYLKKKYISNLYVFDEGGYWESNNKDLLLQKLDYLNKAMDILGDTLSKIDRDMVKDFTLDQLADLLEERLKKGFKGDLS